MDANEGVSSPTRERPVVLGDLDIRAADALLAARLSPERYELYRLKCQYELVHEQLRRLERQDTEQRPEHPLARRMRSWWVQALIVLCCVLVALISMALSTFVVVSGGGFVENPGASIAYASIAFSGFAIAFAITLRARSLAWQARATGLERELAIQRKIALRSTIDALADISFDSNGSAAETAFYSE